MDKKTLIRITKRDCYVEELGKDLSYDLLTKRDICVLKSGKVIITEKIVTKYINEFLNADIKWRVKGNAYGVTLCHKIYPSIRLQLGWGETEKLLCSFMKGPTVFVSTKPKLRKDIIQRIKNVVTKQVLTSGGESLARFLKYWEK